MGGLDGSGNRSSWVLVEMGHFLLQDKIGWARLGRAALTCKHFSCMDFFFCK